jgi:hypothetical protein
VNTQKNPTIHRQHNDVRWHLQAIYARMKQCTTSPSCNTYKNYGGRGVKIAEEWQGGSKAFVQWSLANGYARGLWLEREDNDGDYSPENCVWATPSQQMRNTRRTMRIALVPFMTALEALVAIDRLTDSFIGSVRRRVKRGMSLEEAVARYKPHQKN